MEFYDVINKRRTTREFLDKSVDFEVETGNSSF